jgi:hypothetical protein
MLVIVSSSSTKDLRSASIFGGAAIELPTWKKFGEEKFF